jgi:hypothetical protein
LNVFACSYLLIFVLIRVVSVTEQERQPFLSPLPACVLLFRVEVVLLGAFFDFGFWRVEFFQFRVLEPHNHVKLSLEVGLFAHVAVIVHQRVVVSLDFFL